MAKNSEIKVKRLISLFEPMTENQAEQKQRRASLQELEELCPKEEHTGTSDVPVLHVVRDAQAPSASLESLHQTGKSNIERKETTVQPPTNMFSGDMPKPTHLDKPRRLRDVKELLKMSTNENDRLRSELNTLTKKLESVETAFEALKKEHQLQVEESVKHEALDEATKQEQDSATYKDELRSAQEETAKEKQLRIAAEKRLKVANTKILDLIKRLKEKDKQLLTYKTVREDLKKAEEDLEEEKRIRSQLSAQLNDANEQNAKLIQQLDSVTNNTSELEVTSFQLVRQSKPDANLEILDRDDIRLIARQTPERKKSSIQPTIKRGLQAKSLDFDNDYQFDVDLEKHESNWGKKTVDSGPEYSLPFPELSEACHPIPNLYRGFDRPKRKKRYNARSSVGSLARSDDLVVVYV